MTITLPHSNLRRDGRAAVALSLEKDALIDLRPLDGERIDVREGRVWVTQTDDPQDYVLGAGESFSPRGKGLLVVQALESSVVATFQKGGDSRIRH